MKESRKGKVAYIMPHFDDPSVGVKSGGGVKRPFAGNSLWKTQVNSATHIFQWTKKRQIRKKEREIQAYVISFCCANLYALSFLHHNPFP